MILYISSYQLELFDRIYSTVQTSLCELQFAAVAMAQQCYYTHIDYYFAQTVCLFLQSTAQHLELWISVLSTRDL